MIGKSLRNTLTDKTRNRDDEVYVQTLGLSPGYSDCRRQVLMLPELIIILKQNQMLNLGV